MIYFDAQPRGTLCYGVLRSNFGLSLWDTDLGLSHVDKYTYPSEEYIKAGVLLANGILNSSTHRSGRRQRQQLLIPHVSDDGVLIEIVSLVTLVLEFIFVGSKNSEITGTILQTLVEKAERSDTGLDEKWAWYMALGLGLLYFGGVHLVEYWTLPSARRSVGKIHELCCLADKTRTSFLKERTCSPGLLMRL
ncbi:hypothetical protein C8F04DRAFT_1252305 [Mycena alexandri]|uniref:Uncharacterized protein n=1 Tax=Mycena alexandri TaxID=1745969 RepID=A0AAD6TE82_9AGAR|nr:hypothetical protein C8F04DRAFT_1252305 [Mycena alexandri]